MCWHVGFLRYARATLEVVFHYLRRQINRRMLNLIFTKAGLKYLDAREKTELHHQEVDCKSVERNPIGLTVDHVNLLHYGQQHRVTLKLLCQSCVYQRTDARQAIQAVLFLSSLLQSTEMYHASLCSQGFRHRTEREECRLNVRLF
jgi:hypothetical protein